MFNWYVQKIDKNLEQCPFREYLVLNNLLIFKYLCMSLYNKLMTEKDIILHHFKNSLFKYVNVLTKRVKKVNFSLWHSLRGNTFDK